MLTSNVGGSTYAFTYGARNRLSAVKRNGATAATYQNNALGQRLVKITPAGTERYIYDEAGHLLAEYGLTNRDYIWAGDLPVAVIDNTISGSVTTSTVNYITADQLATPRAVSNAAGATIWSWAYQTNAFGEKAPAASGNYVLNLRFPGQYFDAETGTSYNYFRNYEPATGRYVQSDSIGLMGGMSTFGYASNNPLIYNDSKGLDDTQCMFSPAACGMQSALPGGQLPSSTDYTGVGAETGIAVGAVGGALVVANIVGFPEVEVGEAAAIAIGAEGVADLEMMDAIAGEPLASLTVGGIAGAGPGAIVGGAVGHVLTPNKNHKPTKPKPPCKNK